MQVSVEATSELSRVMKIQVPEEEIQSEISKRLQSLAQKVRLDGFRPGKIPGSVIKKRFSQPVRKEVVAELIRSSLYEALNEEKLQPAGVPAIEEKASGEGEGLTYEASFEIFPEIALQPFENLSITRPVCEVGSDDVDRMIEKLQLQKREWSDVERASATGDQVIVSFQGSVDGEIFEGGSVDDYPLVLGDQKMIPGFEDQLTGLEAGAEKTFGIDFPEDYANTELAGKNVEFAVQVSKVQQATLPEVDAEFVQSFGIESGDPGDLRADIERRMSQEAGKAARNRVKSSVMEALLAANNITLPAVMVDKEIEQIQESVKSSAGGLPEDISDEQKDFFEKEARRRVGLGLLLAEVIKTNNLKADGARVKATIEEMAKEYESPDEVVNWYYSNPEHLRKFEDMVLEEQAIDLILEQASVTDETVEFESLTSQ